MITVMIFDDNTTILEICSFILIEKGYKVFTETSCVDVIEKIHKCKPQVILMDNKIPEAGGVAATQIIKRTEATKNIPVIFFSGNSNIEKLSKDAQADCFLKKPFGINELEHLIKQFTVSSPE